MIPWDMLSKDLLLALDQPELCPDDIVARVKSHDDPAQVGRDVVDHLLKHIEHGGNRTETIVAMVRECRASPFFEDRTINTMHMSLLFGVLDAVREHEDQGQGLRTTEGGTLLHHLVQSDSVFTLMQMMVPGKQMNHYLHPQWIQVPQADGKTALHLLWQRAIGAGLSERAFWAINEGFFLKGAKLDVPDGSGMTVLGLVDLAGRVRPELFHPRNPEEANAMERVLTHLQHGALHQSTPQPASGRARRI